MVTTYCFFEVPQLMQYMFFCFDQDKTGFFEIDDVNQLMNALYDVKTGEDTVKGTVKESWMKLDFSSDKIEYPELVEINKKFPRMFAPAFRLQQQLMFTYMGEYWWTNKARANQNIKNKAYAAAKAKEEKKEKKKEAKKNRKIKKNMGLIRYFCCPWNRKQYDPTRNAYDDLTDEEKEKKNQAFRLAKRKAELAVKNPETTYWTKYKEKTDETKGGSTSYLDSRTERASRTREERSDMRGDRRSKRQHDDDLRIKPRMTVSGVDI